ncbi:MAG: glycosyltransferase family 2 protein [FCB group bacterium]|nr:glycosyltransferase family 2 protein [FCB group bacterium]
MNLNDYQVRRLEQFAFDESCARHLVYYYAVQRDHERLTALRPRIAEADTAGLLACDLLATEDDPDGGLSLFARVAEHDDPWLHHTLAKSLLSRGNLKDVLRLVHERLKQAPGDTNILNLTIQWLIAQGQYKLAVDVAERSLHLASPQDDVDIYREFARRGQALPHELYLEVWPKPFTLTYYLPVYNVERYIRLAIEGLCALSHPLHEILVVNDGTPDRSMDIAREYPVRIVEHDGNRGLAAARNTAFRNAVTQFVGAIDTDAYPDPDLARNYLLEFENTLVPMAGAGGRLIEANQVDPPDRWRTKYLPQHQGRKRLCTPQGLYGSNTLFVRETILKVGGYDEQYRTNGEDVSICHALRTAGYGFFYTPNAVAYHARTDTVASVLKTCWAWAEPGKRQAGYYDDPVVLINSFNDLIPAMQSYLRVDLQADDPELGYLDVLCLFYVTFLDMNAAVRKGTLPAGEARYVEDALLGALAKAEERLVPGLHARALEDIAPLLHEPGGDISEDLKQRVAPIAAKAVEIYEIIPKDFYERMMEASKSEKITTKTQSH